MKQEKDMDQNHAREFTPSLSDDRVGKFVELCIQLYELPDKESISRSPFLDTDTYKEEANRLGGKPGLENVLSEVSSFNRIWYYAPFEEAICSEDVLPLTRKWIDSFQEQDATRTDDNQLKHDLFTSITTWVLGMWEFHGQIIDPVFKNIVLVQAFIRQYLSKLKRLHSDSKMNDTPDMRGLIEDVIKPDCYYTYRYVIMKMSHVFNKFGYKGLVTELLKSELENIELPDKVDTKGKSLHEWVYVNTYNREKRFLDQLIKDISISSEEDILPAFACKNMMKWLGSVQDFACLMSKLAEEGYIEAPSLRNKEVNNTSFATLLTSHYKLDGKTSSLITKLKENSWSQKSKFVRAIEQIPTCLSSK